MRSGVRSPSAPPITSTTYSNNPRRFLFSCGQILDLDPDRFVIVPGAMIFSGQKVRLTARGWKEFLGGMGRIEENTYQTLANELKWGDEPKGWLFDCWRFIIILLKTYKGRAAIRSE